MPEQPLTGVAPKSFHQELLRALDERRSLIPLRADLKLTKTPHNYSEALLLRDLDLEKAVDAWIEERTDYETLISRYAHSDSRLSSRQWPRHVPVRILSGQGSICSGKNIFLFFSGETEDDCVGFEFVDVWSNLFQQAVFPCMRRTFDVESQYSVLTQLVPALDRTIYLASVFHEIGHRVSFHKVSPTKDPRNLLEGLTFDVLGELSTDSLLCTHLSEFPELSLFVFFQRIYWFGRRGYRDNPWSGGLNTDNDAWIGSYLWNLALERGAVVPGTGGYHLSADGLSELFPAALADIDELGDTLARHGSAAAQERLARDWMKQRVTWNQQGSVFALPASLREMFAACQDIPEEPHFTPLLTSPLAADAFWPGGR
ncbi:hypothetical protein NR798_25670 [Archangium gephyra]|uniref:hypothetical protein n=1 Tax=Archangium gephyra TaxID=48 RepID=UPI0035D4D2BE